MRDDRDCTVDTVDCVIRAHGTLGRVSLTRELMELARTAGASSVGVTDVKPFDEGRHQLTTAVRTGMAGPLGFTYDDPSMATDIRVSLPWARSLFVFGVSYIDRTAPPGPKGPIIGRFATEDFYRPVSRVASAVSARLTELGMRCETLIDDNRLADRSAAIRAGVGWAGRSTMVLAPGVGPWMLLGSVATDALLEPTSEMRRECGTCTACIPACPTGAILDGMLDARRCLSTWLQTPGSIPHWIRPILGRRIYGCDECLTSCPPGHPAMRSAVADPLEEGFSTLLALDDDELLDRFSWWFVPRRDGRYLRRNLVVAAGNSGETEVTHALEEQLHSPSSMIRGHAAWALARLGDTRALEVIGSALDGERTPEGREEMLLALLMLEQPDRYAELLSADEMVSTDSAYAGLALIGADLDSGVTPWERIDIVPIIDGIPPVADLKDLAVMVRVNDRKRQLEHLRRSARTRLAGSDAG